MGKLGEYGEKPTPYTDTDTLLTASGAETYDASLLKIREFLNAYFAALNGDENSDFSIRKADIRESLILSLDGSTPKILIKIEGSAGVIEGATNNDLILRSKANTANEGVRIQNSISNDIAFFDAIKNSFGVGKAPDYKIDSAGDVNSDTAFLKDGKYVTRGVASNVNLTTSGTTNVQMNNADDYVFTISAGQTPTLNFNDADFQAGQTINININGGAGLKMTAGGVTFYEIANDGTALAADVVNKYAGNRTMFTIYVESSTKFNLI